MHYSHCRKCCHGKVQRHAGNLQQWILFFIQYLGDLNERIPFRWKELLKKNHFGTRMLLKLLWKLIFDESQQIFLFRTFTIHTHFHAKEMYFQQEIFCFETLFYEAFLNVIFENVDVCSLQNLVILGLVILHTVTSVALLPDLTFHLFQGFLQVMGLKSGVFYMAHRIIAYLKFSTVVLISALVLLTQLQVLIISRLLFQVHIEFGRFRKIALNWKQSNWVKSYRICKWYAQLWIIFVSNWFSQSRNKSDVIQTEFWKVYVRKSIIGFFVFFFEWFWVNVWKWMKITEHFQRVSSSLFIIAVLVYCAGAVNFALLASSIFHKPRTAVEGAAFLWLISIGIFIAFNYFSVLRWRSSVGLNVSLPRGAFSGRVELIWL